MIRIRIFGPRGLIQNEFRRAHCYTVRAWDERMQRSRGKMCPVPSRVRGRRAGPCDVGKSSCFSKVKQPSAARSLHSAWSRCRRQSHPSARHANSRGHIKEQCASPPTSQPSQVLSKLATVLDGPRSSQPLEKEFGVDPGRATMETKHTEVLYGGGSGGRGLPRLGGHAPVHCILHTHHEHLGVITASHETEVREVLAAFPGVSGNVERHAGEYPLLHGGRLRGLRCVSVTVTGDLDASSIGRSERQHAHSVRSTGCSSLQ